MNDEKLDKRERARQTESDIVRKVTELEHLLEKRQAEEQVNTSLVASCESAGPYAPCNPLLPGHCPPEHDFETTFKDMPWANIYTKNKTTDAMERCVPTYLIGRPTGKAAKTRGNTSLEERLLRAVNTLEQGYAKLQDASEFQWTTECGEAQNEAQCGIMREAPQINKVTGNREFQEHGGRCYWAPTQDPQFQGDDDQPLCRPFSESVFRPIPMTQEYIAQVKEKLAENSSVLNQVNTEHKKTAVERSRDSLKITDPYGNVRKHLASAKGEEQYRDLSKGYIQLPLFPLETVAKVTMNAVAHHHTYTRALEEDKNRDPTQQTQQKAALRRQLTDKLGGVNVNKYLFQKVVSASDAQYSSMGDLPDEFKAIFEKSFVTQDGKEVDVDALDAALRKESPNLKFNYGKLREAVAKQLRAKDGMGLCDTTNTSAPYSWEFPDTSQNSIGEVVKKDENTNSFIYTSLLPFDFQTTADKASVYTQAQEVAPKDWWKFTHSALTSQAMFESDFITLVERIYAKLKQGTLLSSLLLKRQVPGNTKETLVDVTPYKALRDETRGELDKMVSNADFIELLPADTLHEVNQESIKDVELKLKDGFDNDRSKWELAAHMAAALVTSSAKGLGKRSGGDKPIYEKALHKAGIGGDPTLRWQSKVGAEIHLANLDHIEESDQERRDRIRAATAKIERLQVARELKDKLHREMELKRGNRVLRAVHASLESARTPEQRYQRAVSFVPSLLKHAEKEDSIQREDIFKMLTKEIARRFNQPPHPLFYNERTNNTYKEVGIKECKEDTTLQHELACRYIHESQQLLDKNNTKDENVESTLEKLKQHIDSERQSKNIKNAKSRLNTALVMEEKYGSGSYVDVKHRSFEPLAAIEDRVHRMSGP